MAGACQLASCGESTSPAQVDALAADASWATDAHFDDAPGEGSVDEAPSEPAEEPPPEPYARPDYVHLAETGLFASADLRETATDAVLFEPTYKLWSDSAVKRRWVRLPHGTKIDTSDMDHWIFPVGTKLWKEFSLDGVRLETRLVERYGTGPEDYWMGAFVWNQEQTDAVLAPDGANDILATAHDAPAQKRAALVIVATAAGCSGCRRFRCRATTAGRRCKTLPSAGSCRIPRRPVIATVYRATTSRPECWVLARQLRPLSQRERHVVARHPDGFAIGRRRPRRS